MTNEILPVLFVQWYQGHPKLCLNPSVRLPQLKIREQKPIAGEADGHKSHQKAFLFACVFLIHVGIERPGIGFGNAQIGGVAFCAAEAQFLLLHKLAESFKIAV